MIVHVVIEGLIAILAPAPGTPAAQAEVYFMDPSGFNLGKVDTAKIPLHGFKVGFTDAKKGQFVSKDLGDDQELVLPQADAGFPLRIENAEGFVHLSEVLDTELVLRPECVRGSSLDQCSLKGHQLVRRKVVLSNGTLRPCEKAVAPSKRVYFRSDEPDDLINDLYVFGVPGLSSAERSVMPGFPTFGALVFTYDSANPQIEIGDETRTLGKTLAVGQPALADLSPNTDFTVIFLTNTAPMAPGHVTNEGHFLVYYDLLSNALEDSQKRVVLRKIQNDGEHPNNECIGAFLYN